MPRIPVSSRTAVNTIYGTALSFKGGTESDRVLSTYTSHSTLRSYSLWVYRVGDGGTGAGRIFDKRVAGAQVELFYNNAGGDKYVFERTWSGNVGKWEFTRPATGAWKHFVLTYDSSATSNDPIIYMNGAVPSLSRTSTPSGTITNNTDAYVIGNRALDNARAWDGYIDDFRIYNSILSPTDVANLYAQVEISASPVVHYKFDEAQGFVALDGVGGNNGTITGASFVTGVVTKKRSVVNRAAL